ncbi:MAG: hypothetical protein Q4C54_06135, partial [Clostridia bacterium]|nr:hypothetical protein [Clostridia bacterium]
ARENKEKRLRKLVVVVVAVVVVVIQAFRQDSLYGRQMHIPVRTDSQPVVCIILSLRHRIDVL